MAIIRNKLDKPPIYPVSVGSSGAVPCEVAEENSEHPAREYEDSEGYEVKSEIH